MSESGIGVGMPAWLKLNHFGREVDEAFGYVPYLVGSAAKTTAWRDVDVRLILPDEEFDRVCGELTRPRSNNARWNALCLAFASRGREVTGLPIDFQIDRQTEANEDYGSEPRHALILATLASQNRWDENEAEKRAYARAVSDVVENRDQLASAFRDWLHETGRGDCNASVDECPDWPLAYQLADIAIGKFEKWAADRKAGTFPRNLAD